MSEGLDIRQVHVARLQQRAQMLSNRINLASRLYTDMCRKEFPTSDEQAVSYAQQSIKFGSLFYDIADHFFAGNMEETNANRFQS